MKRTISTVAALALGLVVNATAVQAQVEEDDAFDEQPVRTFSLGIAGGASVPTGDFGTGREVGFHGAVVLGIRPVNWPVGLRAEGMFHRFAFDGADLNNNLFAGIGDLVLTIPTTGVIRPYIIGGGGVYNIRRSGDEDLGDNDIDLGRNSRTNFGLNGGAGLTFQLSGFNTFLEARFHNVFTDGPSDAQFIPITFGIVF